MSVSGVNNSSNPYALPDETISVSEAGQLSNQFITLMVAQIQNQDPTNPMDSTQFVEQYATISQVQSLENMTKLQQSSLVLADNLQMLTAASLVGQSVTVHADSLQLDGKVDAQFDLQLARMPGGSTSRSIRRRWASSRAPTRCASRPPAAKSPACRWPARSTTCASATAARC